MKWWLALHIISVICWMAGLFYLPRLFVYHAMTAEPKVREQFKVMEYKLYCYIMHPALVATVISGFILIHLQHLDSKPFMSILWLHIKLALVGILVIYHIVCGYYLKQFKLDRNQHSHKFFRLFNEVPTILMIVIVILVTVQPT